MYVQFGVFANTNLLYFLPFSLPSPSSLLNLPIFQLRQVIRWVIRVRQVIPLN